MQAGDYQKTARFYYKKAEDTYYQVPALTLSTGAGVGVPRAERRPVSHAVMDDMTRTRDHL